MITTTIDTEIDWKAYMEEVYGYLNGERNYMKLEGGTGPLVYPAGFVYIFSALYHVTNEGTNIFLGITTANITTIINYYHLTKGQVIFLFVYIISLIIVLILYKNGMCQLLLVIKITTIINTIR
jgi:alpha-1,3-mannosyltransferase